MEQHDNFQQQVDLTLVRNAQQGDIGSFEYLVQLYRKKAYRWAYSVTDDPYLAEDAVQDAFLNVYLRKESLRQVSNFTSWLYRIVRNEALMKVRRGGYYRREKPVPSNWFREYSYSTQNAQIDEPDKEILRLESEEVLNHLLSCLHCREKDIFYAYTFCGLNTKEITVKFSISATNFYKILSRARKKMQNARYRYFLDQYMDSIGRMGERRRRTIDLPFMYMGEIWDSAMCCFMLITKNIYNQPFSLSKIMGLSGQAFRMTIQENEMSIASPLAFHWGHVYSHAFRNLGFHSRYIWNADERRSPELFLDSLEMIRKSIMDGLPVICWNIRNPLFGLIHGFDDELRRFEIIGFGENRSANYEDLLLGEIFIMQVSRGQIIDEESMFLDAIKMIVDHSKGTGSMNVSVDGLEAYNAWIRILNKESVDELGNSFTIAYISDARNHALKFLEACLDSAEHSFLTQRASIRSSLEKAIIHYREVTGIFYKLKKMFPYPKGNNEHSSISEAIKLLERAQKQEELGIEALAEIAKRDL
jgi:RNA polymerase sigma factor (sigma-70 family)